jgi:hypothetical protein
MKFSIFVLMMIIPFVTISNPIAKNGIINSKNGLVLREKPDVSSSQICIMPFGEYIEIYEALHEDTINNIQAHWLKIKYKEYNGFAFGGYIDTYGDEINFADQIEEYKANIYQGGLDCKGLTYSEYTEQIEFTKEDVIYKHFSGRNFSCKAIDKSDIFGCRGVVEIIKIGKYRIENGRFIVNFRIFHQSEKPYKCIDCPETNKIDEIDENFIAIPIVCTCEKKQYKGLIIPGLSQNIIRKIWISKISEN